MKNVLIIGGGLFIGGHLISSQLDYNFYLYGRNSSKKNKEVAKYDDSNLFDIERLSNFIKSSNPDIIIFAISNFSIKENELNYEKIKIQNLIDQLIKNIPSKSRILYLGSSAVYGNQNSKDSIDELSNTNPVTPYGKIKLFEENQFREAMIRYDKKIVFTRIFNLIGPNEPIRMVAGSFVNQLICSNKIKVGNLNPYRDFLDVRDASRALLDISFRGNLGEVYNICSGQCVQISKLLDKIISVLDKNVSIDIDKMRYRLNDINFIVGDNSKLKNTIDWMPEISIDTSINDLIDSYGR